MNYYLNAFKKYAVFKGRSGRKEYWIFTMINVAAYFALTAVSVINMNMAINSGDYNESTIVMAYLPSIFGLAIFVPSLAVAVRRLHDVGKSGWWFLINFIPLLGAIYFLFLMSQAGEVGGNKYGPESHIA